MSLRHFKLVVHLAATFAKILLTNHTSIGGFRDNSRMTIGICFADVAKNRPLRRIQITFHFYHLSHKEILLYALNSIVWKREFFPTELTLYVVSRFLI